MTDEFRHYRRWFYAAAIYNAVWGSAVVLSPATLLRIADVNAALRGPRSLSDTRQDLAGDGSAAIRFNTVLKA